MRTFASVALSSDGYMDDCSSRRLVLSTPADWHDVLRLRSESDAILVGAETIRRDDPSLTLHDETLQRQRIADGRDAEPLKVTLSRSLQLDPAAKFFTTGLGQRLIFTTSNATTPLEASATLIRCPELTAARIVTELEKRGVGRLFIEGGARTLRMFFDAKLIDTLRIAVNPTIEVADPRAPHFDAGFSLKEYPHRSQTFDGMEVTTYTLHPDRTEEDLRYLRMAIEQSRRCTPCATCYRVGAVIVTRGGEIFTGYTHETSPTHHAEQEAITKALAAGADMRGGTIYSSMEPCSTRSSEPESCSEMILRYGFSRTVFALYEPSCFVCCQGAMRLRERGVEVRVYEELGNEVRTINAHLSL